MVDIVTQTANDNQVSSCRVSVQAPSKRATRDSERYLLTAERRTLSGIHLFAGAYPAWEDETPTRMIGYGNTTYASCVLSPAHASDLHNMYSHWRRVCLNTHLGTTP
jgi:hypothetical protein